MATDQAMATLEITGPEDRDVTVVMGDYCPRCWRRLSVAIEALEELLDRHEG
jgi:hypothetical protein